MSFIAELRLALAWNRFDMALATVFGGEDGAAAEATEDAAHQQRSAHPAIHGEELVPLMPLALENSRVDFVKEFLERGLPVGEYLTVAELLRLYQTVRTSMQLSYCIISVLYYIIRIIISNSMSSAVEGDAELSVLSLPQKGKGLAQSGGRGRLASDHSSRCGPRDQPRAAARHALAPLLLRQPLLHSERCRPARAKRCASEQPANAFTCRRTNV